MKFDPVQLALLIVTAATAAIWVAAVVRHRRGRRVRRRVDASALPLLAGAATVAASLGLLRVAGPLTPGDVLLVGFVAAVVAVRVRREERLSPLPQEITLFLAGLAVFFAGGAIAELFGAEPSFVEYTRALIGAGVPLLAWLVWRPRWDQVVFASGAAVVLTVVHILYAIPFQEEGRRLLGWASQYNHFATAAMLLVPAAVLLAVIARSRPARLGWTAAFVVLAVGIVLSGSRAALGGLLVFGALGVVLWFRSRTVIAAPLALLLLAGSYVAFINVASESLVEYNAVTRALGLHESGALSDQTRDVLVDDAWSRVTERPAIGTGFARTANVHNIYLQAWDVAGALGLLGLAVMTLAAVLMGVRARRRQAGEIVPAVGLVAFFAHMNFNNSFWDRYMWLSIGLMLATYCASRVRRSDHLLEHNTEQVRVS